jgi:hypothetical protein
VILCRCGLRCFSVGAFHFSGLSIPNRAPARKLRTHLVSRCARSCVFSTLFTRKLLKIKLKRLAINLQQKMADHPGRCARQPDDYGKRSRDGNARPCREAT